MKLIFVLGLLGFAALAFSDDKKQTSSFPEFQAPPVESRFGLVQAQALADAQRHAKYGVCGMSVFKERIGPIWIFATKVGYGGIAAPDISVTEPASSPPSFGVAQKKANQSPQPLRASGPLG